MTVVFLPMGSVLLLGGVIIFSAGSIFGFLVARAVK